MSPKKQPTPKDPGTTVRITPTPGGYLAEILDDAGKPTVRAEAANPGEAVGAAWRALPAG